MEEEAREILDAALSTETAVSADLASAIRARVAPLGLPRPAPHPPARTREVVGCAPDCGVSGRRLCAVETACLPVVGEGGTCFVDPCDPLAVSVGVCDETSDEDLRCVPTGLGLGTCQRVGTFLDPCNADWECTEGLQCVPFSDGPSPCMVPTSPAHTFDESLATLTSANYEAEFPELGSAMEILDAFRGFCLPLGEVGTVCDPTVLDPSTRHPGCWDCRDGLGCVDDGTGLHRCQVSCTSAADCPCPAGHTASCTAAGVCTSCYQTNAPVGCLLGGSTPCCDAPDATCQVIDGPGDAFFTACCRADGVPCTPGGDECCDGSVCNPGTSQCQTCVRAGQLAGPNDVCCDLRAPETDPLGLEPGLFCPGDCTASVLGPRVGRGCGTECEHAPGSTLPSHERVRVCSKNRVVCVDRDSAAALRATLTSPPQIPSSAYLASGWQSTDTTCNVDDDDCDGRLNDDFAETSCSAPVPGCGATVFVGTNRCDNDASPPEASCVLEPGEDYCEWGVGATPEEHPGGACRSPEGDGGCCDGGGSLATVPVGAECDQVTGGSNDLCRPAHECVVTLNSDGVTKAWNCVDRPACSPPICYEPGTTNRTTSVGDTCGDAPPGPGMGGD